jgi:hypothetical protein
MSYPPIMRLCHKVRSEVKALKIYKPMFDGKIWVKLDIDSIDISTHNLDDGTLPVADLALIVNLSMNVHVFCAMVLARTTFFNSLSGLKKLELYGAGKVPVGSAAVVLDFFFKIDRATNKVVLQHKSPFTGNIFEDEEAVDQMSAVVQVDDSLAILFDLYYTVKVAMKQFSTLPEEVTVTMLFN